MQKRFENIVIAGAGSWGTTFAKILHDAGQRVTLLARNRQIVDSINKEGENRKYLPGIQLPKGICATIDPQILTSAQILFLAVPASCVKDFLQDVSGSLSPNIKIVSLIKGQSGTFTTISQIVRDVCGIDDSDFGIVAGPSLALEIANKQPTTLVCASTSRAFAQMLSELCSCSYIHTERTVDVCGVELGGILKNIVAIATGIAHGLELGDNAKATVLNKGFLEAVEFAVALGAQRSTLMGPAGLGDLIATCLSPLSRNFTAGVLLGRGMSKEQAVVQMNQVAEGLWAAQSIAESAAQIGIHAPLLQTVADIAHGSLDVNLFVSSVFGSKKREQNYNSISEHGSPKGDNNCSGHTGAESDSGHTSAEPHAGG